MSSTKTKRKRKRDEQKVDEGMKAEFVKEEEEMKGLRGEVEVLVREGKLAKRRREQ